MENKKYGGKGIVKAILTSEKEFWDALNKNNSEIPLVLTDGGSCLYLLINDLDEALEEYILTGRSEATELHVFSKEREQSLVRLWSQLGLMVTYRSRQVHYMHKVVTIKYLQVGDPETGMSISLIPWFMLPGRPFPVFVYIYAIWHYHSTDKKSLSESARAGGKLFGIEKLNKSTISRNIKAMENIIDIARIDRPLAVEKPKMRPEQEMVESVPEILKDFSSFESLREAYGEMAKHLPDPVNRRKSVSCVLNNIPDGHSKVIIAGEPAGGKSRDTRKRPARPRGKGSRHVQRPLKFAGSWEIEQTRREFIEICRGLALDAATAYHRFLV